MSQIVKKHLFMRKDIALRRLCLVKYFLSAPLEVQQIDEVKQFSDFRFEDKIDKSKISRSNFKRGVCGMF